MPFNHGRNQIIEHARVNKASEGSSIVIINIDKNSALQAIQPQASHDENIEALPGNGRDTRKIFYPSDQDIPSHFEEPIKPPGSTALSSNNPFHPGRMLQEHSSSAKHYHQDSEGIWPFPFSPSADLRHMPSTSHGSLEDTAYPSASRSLEQKLEQDLRMPSTTLGDTTYALTSSYLERRSAHDLRMPPISLQDLGYASSPSALEQVPEQRVAIVSTSDPSFAPQEDLTRSNSSCHIYTDHMLRRRHGFPLWLPQPDLGRPVEYREKGVDIGDVGIITNNGGFDFLFNIWLPPHGPVNPSDLPENFDLSPRPPKSTSQQKLFDPCSALCSGALKFDTKWATRECFFKCTDDKGAILYLPDGSSLESLANENHLEDLILENAESWYAYGRSRAGRTMGPNSLYLITSCMKASSWGIATYESSMPEHYNILKFAQTVDLQQKYFWEESGSAIARTGPSPDPGLSAEVERQNQCLFVQGFKIGLSKEAWISVSYTISMEKEVNSGRQNSAYSTRASRTTNANGHGKGKSSATNDDHYGSGPEYSSGFSTASPNVNIEHFPPKMDVFHPSDIINTMMLEEYPTARVAFTHDKHWISVLEEGDIPTPETILNRVKYKYKINNFENLAVSLHKNATLELPQDNLTSVNTVSTSISPDTRDLSLSLKEPGLQGDDKDAYHSGPTQKSQTSLESEEKKEIRNEVQSEKQFNAALHEGMSKFLFNPYNAPPRYIRQSLVPLATLAKQMPSLSERQLTVAEQSEQRLQLALRKQRLQHAYRNMLEVRNPGTDMDLAPLGYAANIESGTDESEDQVPITAAGGPSSQVLQHDLEKAEEMSELGTDMDRAPLGASGSKLARRKSEEDAGEGEVLVRGVRSRMPVPRRVR